MDEELSTSMAVLTCIAAAKVQTILLKCFALTPNYQIFPNCFLTVSYL